MFSKVVIALVCLFVVKATTFTINAHDSDDKIEKSNLAEDVLRDTNTITCVDSECNTYQVLNVILLPDGNNDLSIDTSLFGSCVRSQCNTFCRLIGYARGVCVNDNVCRCSGRLASDAALNDVTPENNKVSKDVTLETPLRSCVNSQCQDLCRRLGFAHGVCLTANMCQCTGRLALDATLNDVVPGTVDANKVNSDSESTAENKNKDIPQHD